MDLINFITENSYLIAQILGICALICLSISYFMRKKVLFFSLQTAGNIFTVLSFFVQGEYFASIGCVIATIRTGIFSLFTAKKKEVPWWIVFALVGATVASCVLLWKSALDLIFMLGLIIFTLAFKIKNAKKMRYVLLVPNTLYCIFEFCSRSYAVFVSTFIELVALVVSIIAEEIIERKAKKLSKIEEKEEKDEISE